MTPLGGRMLPESTRLSFKVVREIFEQGLVEYQYSGASANVLSEGSS